MPLQGAALAGAATGAVAFRVGEGGNGTGVGDADGIGVVAWPQRLQKFCPG